MKWMRRKIGSMDLAIMMLVFAAGSGCSNKPPKLPEQQFVIIANTKEKELHNFLDSKQSDLINFAATIAEEPADVQKRATYPYTGKIQFAFGVAKKTIEPDGKSSSQMCCPFVADYRFSKKDQRWELLNCYVPDGVTLPNPEDQIVKPDEIVKIMRR